MNTKYVVLSVFAVASVMTTKMTSEAMAKVLVAVKDNDLEKTFKKLEKEQDKEELSWALVEVTTKKEHMPKAVRCLEIAEDPFPEEESNVGLFVCDTIEHISFATYENTEAFANVVASFKPSAIKPLTFFQRLILQRKDAKNILEQVMTKSPKLITDSLPKWLATHEFDRNCKYYKKHASTRDQAFDYLASHATESVLSKALTIAKKNKHFKADSDIFCCNSEDSYPYDLINNLEIRLQLFQVRNALHASILTFLPTALTPIIGDYLGASMDSLLMRCSKDCATQNIPAPKPSTPVPKSTVKKTLGKRKRDNRA